MAFHIKFLPSKESLKSRELYAFFIEVVRDAILSQSGPELPAGSRHRNTQGWLVVTQPSEPISLKILIDIHEELS